MVTKTYNLEIDVMHTDILNTNAEFVQGDSEVNNLNITILSDHIPVDLSDVTQVTITFKKLDDSVVIGQTTIEDAQAGLVTYLLGTQEVACAGKVIATVELYGQDNMRLTSSQFQFNVRKELGDENVIESTNEFSIMTQIINELQSGSGTSHVHTNMSILNNLSENGSVLRYRGTDVSSTSSEVVDARNGFASLAERLSNIDALIEEALQRIEELGNQGTNPDIPNKVYNLNYSYIGQNSISLDWTAPSGIFTDYRIEYKMSVNSVWSVFVDGMSTNTYVTVSGLLGITSYDFRVCAVNGSTLGIYSDVLTVTTGAGQSVPSAPTNLQSTSVTATSISLSWTAPAGSVTDYIIQYKLHTASTWATHNDGVGTTPSTTVTGLASSTQYDFRVSAVNNVGEGGYSTTAVVSTQGVVPSAPTSLAVSSITASSATLTWTAPAGIITDYIVQYRQSGGAWATFTDGVSATTSATVTGLTHSTAFEFRVAGVNGIGTGNYSNTATGTTQILSAPPNTPTNFAVKGMTHNTALLEWTAPTGTVSDYTIQWKLTSDGTWSTFAHSASTATTVTITGLSPISSYDFHVCAVNGFGSSPYTSTATASTLSDPGDYVRITTTGATFDPIIVLHTGSTATVTWEVEDGGTYSGLRPDINFGSASTRYIRMRATSGGNNALNEIRVFNIGYNINDDGTTDTRCMPDFGSGISYNHTRQYVYAIENVRTMTGLVFFLAATANTLGGSIDFSGMSSLRNIECYQSYATTRGLTSINLMWCSSLRRLCVENADLASIDLNPVADSLIDLRSSGNRSPITFAPLTKPLANLYHFCSQSQQIINHPTGEQMPVVREWWDWQSGQSGALVVRSSALELLWSYGNGWTSADLQNQFPIGGALSASIRLNNCQLSSINLSGCNRARNIELQNNQFQTPAIDGIIAEVLSWGTGTAGQGYVLNLGGTNQPPTLNGATYAQTLRDRGWTVTHNTAVGSSNAPSQVTGLTSTSVATDSVSLIWSVPTGTVTDYNIQYKLHAFSTWSSITDEVSTATTYTVTGLESGSSYDFRVRAVNGADAGAYSTTYTVSTAGVPVTLPWSDNFDRGNITGISNIGNGWHNAVGTMGADIVNNELVLRGSSAYGVVVTPTTGLLPADYMVTMTIPAGARGGFFGLVGRWYNGHGVRVLFESHTTPLMGDAQNYSPNFPWVNPTFPASWSNESIPHTVSLRFIGQTIDLLCDGAIVLTTTSSINYDVEGTEVGFCGEPRDRVRQLLEVTTASSDSVAVIGVDLSPSTSNVVTGNTQQLTATVLPANATNKNVTYQSSNTGIATVSSTGLVTAVSEGSATITVTTADGGYTDTTAITVTAVATSNLPWSDDFNRANVTGIANVGNGWHNVVGTMSANIVNNELVLVGNDSSYGVIATPTNVILPADYMVTFTIPAGARGNYFGFVGRWYGGNGVKVLFAGANTPSIGSAQGVSGNVTISTPSFPASWSNESISHTVSLRMIGTTIELLCDGSVVSSGTCTINATQTGTEVGFCGESDNRIRPLIEVTAIDAIAVTGVDLTPSTTNVGIGHSQQLTALITPSNATNKNVIYQSSNTNVATVSSTGLVTAIAEGTATITVTTANGGFTDTTAITVTAVATSNLPWSDNFDRADVTGIANVGNGWHNVIGSMSANIVSNDLVLVGNDTSYGAIATPTSGTLPADYMVKMTIPAGNKGSYFGLMGRWYNSTGVRVLFTASENYFIIGDASNYWDELTTTTPNLPASWSNNTIPHTVALRFVGTTVELIIDNQIVCSCTSTTNATQTGTEVGFCGESDNRVRNSIEVSESVATIVPEVPTGLTSTGVTGSSVSLSWTAPSGIVTDYTVQYKLHSDGSWSTFTDGTTILTTTTVTGLLAESSYDFRVCATNNVGSGSYSSTYTVSTTSSGTGSILWEDTFDRANCTGIANVGNGWHSVVNSVWDMSIANNDVVLTGNGSFGTKVNPAGGSLPADYLVEIGLPAGAKGNYFGICGRWYNGSGVGVLFDSPTSFTVGNPNTFFQGTWGVPFSTQSFPASWSNDSIPHTLGLRFSGTTVEVLCDGQVVATSSSPYNLNNQTGTEVGFCGDGFDRHRTYFRVTTS